MDGQHLIAVATSIDLPLTRSVHAWLFDLSPCLGLRHTSGALMQSPGQITSLQHPRLFVYSTNLASC